MRAVPPAGWHKVDHPDDPFVVALKETYSMQHRIARLGALLSAGIGLTLAVAGAAQSQTTPAERGRDPIVVQGERLSRSAAEQRAAGFIRTTGVASGETPAARWVDPICPGVTGLTDFANGVATARIRRIAEAAGAPVAPEPCLRNLVVTFTPDGAGLARAISQQDSRRTSELSRGAREALLTGAAPIRWMYSTEIRSRDGQQQSIAASGEAHGGLHTGEGSGTGMPGPGGLMLYNSSVVSTLTERVIISAIVIIDQDEVMGRRLDSLADYAAFVALAEIRGAGATPEGSILGMFAAPDASRNLTAQDTAFLRALYRLPLDRLALQHRGILVDQITDALATTDP
jgi:hypothetical protein